MLDKTQSFRSSCSFNRLKHVHMKINEIGIYLYFSMGKRGLYDMLLMPFATSWRWRVSTSAQFHEVLLHSGNDFDMLLNARNLKIVQYSAVHI